MAKITTNEAYAECVDCQKEIDPGTGSVYDTWQSNPERFICVDCTKKRENEAKELAARQEREAQVALVILPALQKNGTIVAMEAGKGRFHSYIDVRYGRNVYRVQVTESDPTVEVG